MTAEESLRRRIELYRRMTGQQRVQISLALYELWCVSVRRDVKCLHPDWTDEQVQQEVRRRKRLAAGIPEYLPCDDPKEPIVVYTKPFSPKNSSAQ
jgi:hypothetical protein